MGERAWDGLQRRDEPVAAAEPADGATPGASRSRAVALGAAGALLVAVRVWAIVTNGANPSLLGFVVDALAVGVLVEALRSTALGARLTSTTEGGLSAMAARRTAAFLEEKRRREPEQGSGGTTP